MTVTPEIGFGLLAQLVFIAGILWKASSVITRLETALSSEREDRARLEKMVATMNEGLKALAVIPLHEQRIHQLELIAGTTTSKVETMWRKIMSLDKHVAVQRALSDHNIDGGDTDPPPRG